MTATMLVKAAPGKIFLGPGGVRITDAAAVRVPSTAHYRRGLRCGDLVPGEATPAGAPAIEPAPMPVVEVKPEPKAELAPSSEPIRRRGRSRSEETSTGEES